MPHQLNDAPPEIPQSLLALMAELGPKWGTAITEHTSIQCAAFDVILRDAPKKGRVERNLPYGSDPRQVVDVFSPPGARGAPVVIFVHGGAFVVGNKDRTPEIFSNVCWYFARHGIVGVNMEYRLAPQNKYPSGVVDVGSVVAWVKTNIERFGGDPKRIYLIGHSAGGAHAGCYAYDKRFHPSDGSGPGLSGLILVSSRVRIDDLPENPNANNVRAYFGTSPERMKEGSVITHVTPDVVPTMIAIAQWENPLLDIYGLELAHALAVAKGRAPRTLWLEGHNHSSSMAHFNTADERLGREILAFIESGH